MPLINREHNLLTTSCHYLTDSVEQLVSRRVQKSTKKLEKRLLTNSETDICSQSGAKTINNIDNFCERLLRVLVGAYR